MSGPRCQVRRGQSCRVPDACHERRQVAACRFVPPWNCHVGRFQRRHLDDPGQNLDAKHFPITGLRIAQQISGFHVPALPRPVFPAGTAKSAQTTGIITWVRPFVSMLAIRSTPYRNAASRRNPCPRAPVVTTSHPSKLRCLVHVNHGLQKQQPHPPISNSDSHWHTPLTLHVSALKPPRANTSQTNVWCLLRTCWPCRRCMAV